MLDLSFKKGILLICFAIFYSSGQLVAQDQFISKEKAQEIDALFSPFANKPGCAVGIFHQGANIFQNGYGLANLDYDIEITPQTVFETASMSKQFTAACIYLLEEEGKLDLDESIRKYLPSLPKYEEGEPTIRQLIHHTGGITDYLALIYIMGKEWNISFDSKEFMEMIEKQKNLCFTPGQKYSYSNSGYMLLAEIVKAVSGQSIGNYAKEQIFKPLGMNHTRYYENKGEVIKNRAIGYTLNEDSYEQNHYFNFIAAGDGGVYTSVEDFLQWSRVFTDNPLPNKRLPEKLLRRGIINSGDTITYASGLEYGELGDTYFYAHTGFWAAFNGIFIYLPEKQLSVVTLSNNEGANAWRIGYQIVDILLDRSGNNQEIPQNQESKAAVQLSTEVLTAFCGDYFDAESGYTRKIYLKDDTLRYSRGVNNESRLLPINDHTFQMVESSAIQIEFRENDNNRKCMFVSVFGGDPIEHVAYQASKYNQEQLQTFCGNFRSEALGVDHTLSIEDEGIALYVGTKRLELFVPGMEKTFISEHTGYMVFSGDLQSFTLVDQSLGKLIFTRQS